VTLMRITMPSKDRPNVFDFALLVCSAQMLRKLSGRPAVSPFLVRLGGQPPGPTSAAFLAGLRGSPSLQLQAFQSQIPLIGLMPRRPDKPALSFAQLSVLAAGSD